MRRGFIRAQSSRDKPTKQPLTGKTGSRLLYFHPLRFSTDAIRRQFPILRRTIGGQPLVYLDSAATSQKPQAVLDAMGKYYEEENANVHRGMHALAERATGAYEDARETAAAFVHAVESPEIIFTKSCTEAINLVAKSWGKANLQAGDTVVLSVLEHHSNIVPWLQMKEETGIRIEWIDMDNGGNLRMDQLEETLAKKVVKIVAVTGLSNVIGVRPPLRDITERARAAGARVLVDAAQLVGHAPVDVRELDCDFLAFSGHKIFGPTGIGVLYAKRELLEAMPPFLGGGMMIAEVKRDRFVPAGIPQKFEAGTPPIAEAVGLKAAMDWLGQYAWADVQAHEQRLLRRAVSELSSIEGLHILCHRKLPASRFPPPAHHGCLSFVLDAVHPHDLTDILGRRGVCLRAGHHCTQPLHERLGVKASTRLSVSLYNTEEEIAEAASAIAEVQQCLLPCSH